MCVHATRTRLVNLMYDELSDKGTAGGLDMKHIHTRSGNLLGKRGGELLINNDSAGRSIHNCCLCRWNRFFQFDNGQIIHIDCRTETRNKTGKEVD